MRISSLWRSSAAAATEPEPFGAWLVRTFAQGEAITDLPFARLERVCSNVGSIICGAAYAGTPALPTARSFSREVVEEATLVGERTTDAFRAATRDADNVVVSWPWDHLGTRVAWRATQAGDPPSAAALGEALLTVGAAYALTHREQPRSALELWEQVAGGLRRENAEERPNLALMAQRMLTAYEAELAEAAD